MKVTRFSPKQLEIFKFAMTDESNDLVAHGSVRSGKTLCMSVAFLMWAMDTFDGVNLGICGKTVNSAIKNIVLPLISIPSLKKYYMFNFSRSMNCLTVKFGKKKNYFYVYGGSDERSQDLIQGITLHGLLMDEVALMPESFVNQAIARTISVPNAKRFFNCNPDNPNHYFYQKFIKCAKQRNIVVLHFCLEDNPSLDEKQIEKAKSMYTGVFYERYILGKWVKAEGLVYPMFDDKCLYSDEQMQGEWYVSMDYGTLNPTAMHLWCVDYSRHIAFCTKEYYYNGREVGVQKTDTDYYEDLERLTEGHNINYLIIDPSASSFIAEVRKRGKYTVKKAKNDVLEGIRTTATYLKDGKIKIHKDCEMTKQEFNLYSWDDKKTKDSVIKEDDHACDSIRYFCFTILRRLNW